MGAQEPPNLRHQRYMLETGQWVTPGSAIEGTGPSLREVVVLARWLVGTSARARVEGAVPGGGDRRFEGGGRSAA